MACIRRAGQEKGLTGRRAACPIQWRASDRPESARTPGEAEARATVVDSVGPASPAAESERNTTGVTRRRFLRAMGSVAGGVTLAGCGTASAMGTLGTRAVQLVYQDERGESYLSMARRMLEQFHASHPGVRVYFAQDAENATGRMLADFQSGTAPDVLVGSFESLPLWAQSGYLLDLRPFVEADLDRAVVAEWDPAHYDAFLAETGARFAVPKCRGSLVLYYNKGLFDQCGVEHPSVAWTHDDYLEAMRGLARPLDSSGKLGFWGSMVEVSWGYLQVHVNGWGGHFVDPHDPKRSLMAEPETLDALRWLRERMWGDRTMASLLDVQSARPCQAFIEGQLAMVEAGSW